VKAQPRKDGASSLRAALTDALLEVPFMNALSDRRLLIYMIRRDVSDLPDVQEHDESRLHAVRIVMVCHGHSGGLRALHSALCVMAPDVQGTRAVADLLSSASLRALLPEQCVKQVYDLIRQTDRPDLPVEWHVLATETGVAGATPTDVLDALLDRPRESGAPPACLVYLRQLADLVPAEISAEIHRWVRDQAAWLEISDLVSGGAAADGTAPPARAVDAEAGTSQHRADQEFRPPPTSGHARVKSTISTDSPLLRVVASDGGDGVEPHADDHPEHDSSGDTSAMSSTTAIKRSLEPLPQVWGNVPPRNPHFTGREELLAELHEQLREVRETAVLPQALRGMGGVGKSQLAIEYVHRYSRVYNLVWWISAEQTAQILTALTDLAQRLKLEASTEANVAVPAVREALSTGRTGYENWLLVFDNAENLEEVREYFPTGGAGKILVTSRNQEWERVARTLEVDVFTRTESTQFIVRRAPELSESDAGRLAEALGDLPLAVEQAAAWRAATGMPADEYLDLLDAKRVEKRIELLSAMSSPDYGLSVAAAWDLSFDRLEQTSPAAMQLLQVCSFFAPEPISRRLFVGSPSAPITPELDEILADPIRFARAIRAIQKYALARFDHREEGTLQMHRLIQQVLVGRMADEQRERMRQGAHTMLANANPLTPESPDQWKRYQALLPHIRVSGALASKDLRVRELVFNAIRFQYAWGDHTGCETMAVEAYDHWRAALGESDQLTLELAKYLAFVLWVNGNYEGSRELNERTLQMYLTTVGDEDEGTLDAMSNLAVSLRAVGDYNRALSLDQVAFDTARRVISDDDPATLRFANHLAVSLRFHAKFAQSQLRDEETYRKRCEVIGQRNVETLRTLINLGIDQREGGDYLGAWARLEDAHGQCLGEFGPDAPITMQAARHLAIARRKAGHHQAARSLAEETLRKLSRRYGDDYPDTMATALTLSIDLRHADQLAEAVNLGRETLARYHQKFGSEHLHTIAARINLSVALRAKGDVGEALRSDREAVALLAGILGPDHAVTLTCATNLGSDLYAIGEVQAAYELDVDTSERCRRMLGEDHPSALACAANLALDLRALERVPEADKIQSETVVAYRRVLGEKHPATQNVLLNVRADCDVDPVPL